MKRILPIAALGMALIACSARAPVLGARSSDPQLVLDKTWQWVATVTPVETIEVSDPERYTLFLASGDGAKIRFDCNRGGGKYEISTGKISFGPLISTRMACPEDSLDIPFMRDLERVVSFFIERGTLCLELPYDSGTMKFQPEQ